MEKEFLAGWWKMFSKKHHVQASDLLWLISLIAFVLSVIGVFTLGDKENHFLRITSMVGLIIIGAVYLWHMAVQIPAEMFKEVREESKSLLDLQSTQKRLLLDNPSVYVQVLVKRIILFQSSTEHTNYAEVELYIMNGSIFPLEYEIELKETELTADHVSLNKLSSLPFVYKKGPEKLEEGRLQRSTVIRQTLGGDIADCLYKPDKAIYSQWRLHLFLTIKFEGHSKPHEYALEWDGVIDRNYSA